MALIHRATIRPTKAELLNEWVPTNPWGAGELELVGAYRFDDPAGEVGIETHVLRSGRGNLLHVPLTYRGAPLDVADQFLICTMEHSVLGRRWIYDATADPVYADVLLSVLVAGAGQAEEIVEGADTPREPSVRVTGSGFRLDNAAKIVNVSVSSDASTTVMDLSGSRRIVVRRRLDQQVTPTGREFTLTGSWSGLESPVLLAYVA